MYLCLCKGITESDVEHVARSGISTPDALIEALALDDDLCCGRCALEVEDFVSVARHVWMEAHPLQATQ